MLDSTGDFVSNSLGLYVCDDGISLQNSFTNTDGTVYQQRLGNGAFCVNKVGPTVQTGAQVTLTICPWQYALMGLLMGGKVAYNVGGDAIGWSMPDPDELNTRRICLEAWTLAIDGEVQASDSGGNALWHHGIWPQATAVVGDFTWEDAVNPFNVVFTVTPNDNVGNGPFNNWPDFDNDSLLDGHPTGPFASYLDNAPPAALCEVTTFTEPAS
jgi:hypothetical protein